MEAKHAAGYHIMSEGARVCLAAQKPSLLQLCMQRAAASLSKYAHALHSLPCELAVVLIQKFLCTFPGPSFSELVIVCATFCKPHSLRLSGVDGVNSRGMQHLPCAGKHLVRLDLRGCTWLDDLSFIPGLQALECLNVRDCQSLPGDCLKFIQQLPQLQCLDVENVISITDALAAHFIPGMRTLRALNVSGTSVSNGLVEALTYGCRLQAWKASQQGVLASGVLMKQAAHRGSQVEQLMEQWPVSHLIYLRLQLTHITQAVVSHLLVIPDLLLLDVRGTNVTGRSLCSIQAKQRLVALPNNSKLVARTNLMLARVLGGECGCSALVHTNFSQSSTDVKDKLVVYWEQAALLQLLTESSQVRSNFWV